MRREIGFLGRDVPRDVPFPDFFAEVAEDFAARRLAESTPNFRLPHAGHDARQVFRRQHLFQFGDDLPAVEADHVAVDAGRLAAVFPGHRAVVVAVDEAGLAHAAAHFGLGGDARPDLGQIDRIAGRQQGGGDGGEDGGDPAGQFHREFLLGDIVQFTQIAAGLS